jgi:hypothetical protein
LGEKPKGAQRYQYVEEIGRRQLGEMRMTREAKQNLIVLKGRSLKVLKERKKRREGATDNTNNYSDEEEKEEKVSGWMEEGGNGGKIKKMKIADGKKES